MNSHKKSYKYINLLARIIIGIVALIYIYFRLKDDIDTHLTSFSVLTTENYILLLIALLLMPVNWGTEAFKWKFVIRKFENVPFIKALKHVFAGITIGLTTPNRIGEIPARVYLLDNKTHLTGLIGVTFLASFSQVIITFLGGFVAIFFLKENVLFKNYFTLWMIVGSFVTALLFLVYFYSKSILTVIQKIPFLNKKKWLEKFSFLSAQEKSTVLFFSLMRYFVFVIQFYLVLTAFHIQINNVAAFSLIPLFFVISSFIPTFIISEIAVRGSVALVVFSTVSTDSLLIISAAVSLWIINVALPSIIGISGLKQLKF
ncbi:MAG: flippase-like domain-containing protein [Flavobacteriales bacterium]|nr:flippase-like domain-containing protein [Flavobacteriales bacterium]MCW8913835.1 flippase-like domain-containing protein [Flavobacteriales bacterium]MCW8937951.1 flippase-like domain-containing protein [Flavobacteriales bacterium]MCW8941422.1 flippase-like domain-containing protein [Flavobacteriales bacterium]MCW8968264.1 flippase-like domain-containing protein [Flavobacteriales bacterium]